MMAIAVAEIETPKDPETIRVEAELADMQKQYSDANSARWAAQSKLDDLKKEFEEMKASIAAVADTNKVEA
jgi:predicted  nucleic acid-binding Zn-ribbon protein